MIKHVLTILVFWFPSIVPVLALAFSAPSSNFLDQPPSAPLPPVQKRDAQHKFLQHKEAHTQSEFIRGPKTHPKSFILGRIHNLRPKPRFSEPIFGRFPGDRPHCKQFRLKMASENESNLRSGIWNWGLKKLGVVGLSSKTAQDDEGSHKSAVATNTRETYSVKPQITIAVDF